MAATYEMTAALADELCARGLEDVCISPGSRSTPLALTFARHPGIRHWIHHDERSSGFFALGLAKTTGRAVGVITTSGTATAELHPAVVEARFGRVPLIVMTADRPPALRGTGANQTIDQVDLYGTSAKWFTDAPLASTTDGPTTRALAGRAWRNAMTAPAGPVHLNLPIDEPLVSGNEGIRFETVERRVPGAASPPRVDDASLRALGDMAAGRRGVLIVGPLMHNAAAAIADLARATGFPILPDPLSGLRAGHHDLSLVVAHYDALAQAGFLDSNAPEVAIRFGPQPTSKAINTWLARHPDVGYAVVDTTGWRDPGGTARLIVTADPAAVAQALAGIIARPTPPDWPASWLAADVVAADALLDPAAPFGELNAIDTVLTGVPDGSRVWVASSMPIRQVDLLHRRSTRAVHLLANRGASGIDGFLSASLGSATADRTPTYAVAGDLSAYYDLTALAWAGRHHTDVTIVVVNNDGGGIFHLLPQAPLPEFEELFGTPHGLEFEAAAHLFRLAYTRVGTGDELAASVARPPSGPHLVEARFDRAAGAAAYRAAVERVRAGLGIGLSA